MTQRSLTSLASAAVAAAAAVARGAAAPVAASALQLNPSGDACARGGSPTPRRRPRRRASSRRRNEEEGRFSPLFRLYSFVYPTPSTVVRRRCKAAYCRCVLVPGGRGCDGRTVGGGGIGVDGEASAGAASADSWQRARILCHVICLLSFVSRFGDPHT